MARFTSGVRSARSYLYVALLSLSFVPASALANQLFVDPQFGVSVTSNVQYATKPTQSGSKNLRLDVYQPTGAGLPEQLPAIVLMHGGYFVDGIKTDSPMVELANQFASRGYVAVSIDYRVLPNFPPAPGVPPAIAPDRVPDWVYPELLDPLSLTLDQYLATIAAAVSDQATAVNWLADHAATYHINPDWIAAGGFSAGAVSSLMLAAGAIDGASANVNAVFSMAGGMFGLESSIGPDSPGVYILHGDQDDTVPFAEVGYLQNALASAGVPFVSQILPGVDHSSSSLYGAVLSNPDPLFEFMAQQLVPEPASYVMLGTGVLALLAVGRRRIGRAG